VIGKHADVSEVCVVGVIDPDGGDRIPRAFVKLKTQNGRIPNIADEIRKYANGNLQTFQNSIV